MIHKGKKFVCIGAFHKDYVMHLKANYYKNRTNPITQEIDLGGVAYRIASKLSFLNTNTELISLNCDDEYKIELKKKNIMFTPITKKKFKRNYTAILNNKGEMILGLANMDNYEKNFPIKVIRNKKNENIIMDLNLSHKTIKSLINKLYIKNNICIIGTSAHKVYKIKNSLKKIHILILNKQESFNLTGKNKILDSLKSLIEQNKKIKIIITNGKNTMYSYNNNLIYSCKPIRVNIKNENGAGDIMSSLINYYLDKECDFKELIRKSMIAGALQVSGYKTKTKKTYLKYIKKLSKKIKMKVISYNA